MTLPPRFYTARGWAWLAAIVPIYLFARNSVFVVIVMSAWANYASDRAVAEGRRAQITDSDETPDGVEVPGK